MLSENTDDKVDNSGEDIMITSYYSPHGSREEHSDSKVRDIEDKMRKGNEGADV